MLLLIQHSSSDTDVAILGKAVHPNASSTHGTSLSPSTHMLLVYALAVIKHLFLVKHLCFCCSFIKPFLLTVSFSTKTKFHDLL